MKEHLEKKRLCVEELKKVVLKQLASLDLWEKYFESDMETVEEFKISDNLDIFTE
jgi:hypothetical protein